MRSPEAEKYVSPDKHLFHQRTIWQGVVLGALMILVLLLAMPVRAQELEPMFQVTLTDAEDALGQALASKGAAEHVKAIIENTRNQVFLRYGRPISIGVKTLTFNPDEQSFKANIFFLDGQEVVSALPVSGRFEEMVEVPMLKQSTSGGTVIEAENVVSKLMPVSRVREGTIKDAGDLIGKTPRRAISQNRPVRVLEVKSPDIVSKGKMVTMRYQTPFMTISTIGEALQAGGEGETIKVKNPESNAVVTAIVGPDGDVLVGNVPQHAQLSER